MNIEKNRPLWRSDGGVGSGIGLHLGQVKSLQNAIFQIRVFNLELLCLIGLRPVVAQGTKCACKFTGCGFDPHSRNEIFIYIYIFISSLGCRGESAALSFAIQYAMPPEIGGKWGTECLNTRFPLPTLLCAGYSVKLI